jgi:hypothetical protein
MGDAIRFNPQLLDFAAHYRFLIGAGQRNVTEVPLKNGCNWIF